MSNGGPHGDKWNKFQTSTVVNDSPLLSSDQVLDILNLQPDGYYATGAVTVGCTDGVWLFVGYYGQNQQ